MNRTYANRRRHRVKLAPIDQLFHVLVFLLLLFIGIVTLLPLLHVLAQSLSDPYDIVAGRVTFWPVHPTLKIYKYVIASNNVRIGFLNTLFYAGVGTALNLVMTVLCAYPLSRRDFFGRSVFTFIFAFTMMFGGGMIPTYLNIKALGLLNTRLVMILPGAMTIWNMVLCRTFFQSIPEALYEAAFLDGARDSYILWRIVLPLSTPIIAVLALFYAVGHWNSYFDAMMYLRDRNLYNVQLMLRNAISNVKSISESNDLTSMLENEANAEATKYVIIVVVMLPIMLIYPFVQKYFIKGIMIGSIKG